MEKLMKWACKGSKEITNSSTVLFIGLPGVGRTTIMKRLANMYLSMDGIMPLLNNQNSTLNIKLTKASFFETPHLRRLCISTADAIVLMYAVDDTDSFDFVTTVIDEIKEIKGPEFSTIVAANKSDKNVDVVKRFIADWSLVIDYKCKHIDTVANVVSDTGVLEISRLLMSHCLKKVCR